MRLYSLKLRAVGPFPDEHHVDFAALGRSGLFLMEGPTGAGKSTIIDAVVFALYGQLAGLGASKQRLHSHHAQPGVEPFVDLVFEVESGVFRIRRTPSFERPKKRGTGSRTINESVMLMRLADVDDPENGEVLSTRAQEAGDEVVRLIGLKRDQFLQTVVLPQGEFATFLRATGEDRKRLLETIFRTDIYERITRELKQRRSEAGQRTADAERTLQSCLDLVHRVADSPVESVDTLVVEVARAREDSRAVVERTRTALRDAETALRHSEEVTAALVRRADLLERRARLESSAPDVVDAAAKVSDAQRAAHVHPLVKAERAAVEAQAEAATDHQHALAVVPADTDPQEAVDDLSGQLAEVAALAKVESDLPRRDHEREQWQVQHDDLVDQLQQLTERAEERPDRRAALIEKQQECAEKLTQRSALEAGVTDASRRHEAAVKAHAEHTSLVQAETLVKQFAGDATTATHVVKELQLARIQGMAGELAESLVVGEACMVCGSDAHPHPAARSSEHPDVDQVDAAERRLHDLQGALSEAKAALDVTKQQHAFWTKNADGLSPDQAKAAWQEAEAILAGLDEVEQLQAKTGEAIEQLDQAERLDEQRRSQIQTKQAGLSERITQATDQLAADRRRITETLNNRADTLADLRDKLQAERAAFRRVHSTSQSLVSADSRLNETHQALVEALTVHEFSDPAEVEACVVPTAEVERLQHQIDAHTQEANRVADGLAEPAVAALTGDETPDLDAAKDTRAAAADAHEAAVGLADVADRRHQQVTRAVDDLHRAEESLKSAQGDAQAVVRLAALAEASTPENLKNLTLGTYVLLRRFEEVVAAANARLGPMSDGRYHLRVSDERERTGSGRRTGLALAVIDAETGREREPRTLSGGETFYVSLCLALGLADVVTAESGGVQLGTLFVDEGFGSLDPQTLDAVMAQLATLAQGGRTVGLVSHVEDLKQRVADRISVRRHRDGSSSLTVRAGLG